MSDQWPYSVDELHAMTHAASAARVSDEQKLAYWTERAGGPEVVERARERAVGLIGDAASSGSLDLLAGHLSRRCFLSGDDVARILTTKGTA